MAPPPNNSLGFFAKSGRIPPAFLTGTTRKCYSQRSQRCCCIKIFAKSVRGLSSISYHFQPNLRCLAFAWINSAWPTTGSAPFRIPYLSIDIPKYGGRSPVLWSPVRWCPLWNGSHLLNTLCNKFRSILPAKHAGSDVQFS
jgi:hypothetical protein